MLKYEDFLKESLAVQAKSEPKTNASRQARKLGLTYMGFGRYADNKGALAYIVQNDTLVPYKSQDDVDGMYIKAMATQQSEPASKKKTATAGKGTKAQPAGPSKSETLRKEADTYNNTLRTRKKEDGKILMKNVDKELFKFYQPDMFGDDELQALTDYTDETYGPINRYLYKGHDDGVTPEQDQQITSAISAMDSAFEETQAPFDYTVYSGLSSRYTPDKIQVKGEYLFRGYVSASLDFNTAIGGFADVGNSDQPVVLQIEVKRGQKSIYMDAISSHPGEQETLLPRGSKVQVVSGPHVLDASLFTDAYGTSTIALFHCKLVEDQ